MTACVAVSGEAHNGASSPDSKNNAASPANTRDDELDKALAEAEASIDARTKAGSESGKPVEDGEHLSADAAVTEAMIQAKKELEEALEQTRKEAEQLRERWMRSAADLENHRRRAAKEREDIQKFGIEKLLKDFLPVIDDLDRAVQVIDVQSEANVSDAAKQLLGGVQMVQKKFVSQLEKHGVTSFEARGESFNPERHEAVQQSHSEFPSGAVAAELQRGFLIHDRLLRPALVVVSLGPEGDTGSSKGSE